MKLMDLIQRGLPNPWSEGDNIPWNEPGFSERMLKEHLSQAHDAASRKTETIDHHVGWIQDALLNGQPARVLDLGCGPGLYSNRLARLGCTCHGVDFSPASIRHARAAALADGLACSYDECDLRSADFGQGYDLGMLIYGEFNVFQPGQVREILRKLYSAIKPGGQVLLEISTLDSIRKIGLAGTSWYSSESGLFSDQPHLCLQESVWDETGRTATTRHYIVAVETAAVTRHATSYQGYDLEEIEELLIQAGFDEVRFFPALGVDDTSTPPTDFIAVSAVRG